MEQGEGEQRVTISVFLRTVCNHIGAASMKDRILRLHFCCLKDRMQLKKKKGSLLFFFSKTLCNHIGADFPNDDISRLHSSF